MFELQMKFIELFLKTKVVLEKFTFVVSKLRYVKNISGKC